MNIDNKKDKVCLAVVDGNIRFMKYVPNPYQPLVMCQMGFMEFPNDWLLSHTREEFIELFKKRVGNALYYTFKEVLKTNDFPAVIKVEPDENSK